MKRVRLASGIELDCVDEGPRDAPALMFLHGFPESHRAWRHQIAHFSENYRCVAPDQRGYRGSSKPPEESDYATEKLVADLFQLADALGIERFTILGHDWGGAIAWLVAMMGQGTRVERAIIANAPHPQLFQRLLWSDPAQRAASQYIRLFRDASLDPLIRDQGLAPVLTRAFGGANAFAGQDPAEMAELLAYWRDPDGAMAMLNWYRASALDVPAMDAPFGLQDRNLPNLPSLAIPLLVIWGQEDTALLPANIDGLPGVARDPEVVLLQGCGHFTPWQAADAVNAAIGVFLRR